MCVLTRSLPGAQWLWQSGLGQRVYKTRGSIYSLWLGRQFDFSGWETMFKYHRPCAFSRNIMPCSIYYFQTCLFLLGRTIIWATRGL